MRSVSSNSGRSEDIPEPRTVRHRYLGLKRIEVENDISNATREPPIWMAKRSSLELTLLSQCDMPRSGRVM